MHSKIFSSKDLTVFSKIGSALWMDEDYSERSSVETLSAASLLQLTAERTLEKALAGLLEKSKRGDPQTSALANSGFLGQKFFRLPPEARLVLVALHLGRWSYERLCRILQCNREELEELAWSARLGLCSNMTYPAAPYPMGIRCPDYHRDRPWTQKILDEEILVGRDRIFLQNHLTGCDACAQALARARKIYFKVDEEVAEVLRSRDMSGSLEQILNQSFFQRYPSERTFLETLKIFGRRIDIQMIVVLMLVWTLYKLF